MLDVETAGLTSCFVAGVALCLWMLYPFLVTVVEELAVLPLPWRVPTTFGAEVLLFGVETALFTGCFGAVTVLKAWAALCLLLGVFLAAAPACAETS